VNQYSYDPHGNILGQREQIPQSFKYVCQYGVMAEPNGFYYMRARYYDPKVGRFVSEDPSGFEGGDVNLYAYVKNNPINAIDPEGLAESCGGNKWFSYIMELHSFDARAPKQFRWNNTKYFPPFTLAVLVMMCN
jgi:RHS repeat-associated protein